MLIRKPVRELGISRDGRVVSCQQHAISDLVLTFNFNPGNYENKICIYLILIVFVSSCTENFEDFNTDKKNPADGAGEALFTNALKNLADQMNNPDVNRNILEIWAQYWNETTYTDEANYDIVEARSAGTEYSGYLTGMS